MNIDFHYGVIYVTARLGGMSERDAEVVAHSCQYVDDATIPGILDFADGESFERLASAHKMYDYKNGWDRENRVIWTPFHFIPGGEGDNLEAKSICRPDSAIARDMIRHAIKGKGAGNALHRLGVSLHTYVDTWAHQGFSGTRSPYNVVTFLEGDQHDPKTWKEKLENFTHVITDNVKALALDAISDLGHGSALHFPDMPWAKWKYKNGHGREVVRDNLPDFVAAADMSCRVVQGFLNGNGQFENEGGLGRDAKQALEKLLAGNQDHDEERRLAVLATQIANGDIPGLKEALPAYISKGPGSWKHIATGITEGGDGPVKPKWSKAFEDSDYRKVHDAIKQHRYVVTQEILPAHGVRLA